MTNIDTFDMNITPRISIELMVLTDMDVNFDIDESGRLTSGGSRIQFNMTPDQFHQFAQAVALMDSRISARQNPAPVLCLDCDGTQTIQVGYLTGHPCPTCCGGSK